MAYRLTWGGYVLRLIAAIALVFGTYNPDGWSYLEWIRPVFFGDAPAEVVMAFVGVVVIIGWAIFLRATFRSLGVIGTVLAISFFGTLIWVLIAYTPLSADNLKIISYLVLLALALVLSAGISWSHVRRRMTGQVDVDETDS